MGRRDFAENEKRGNREHDGEDVNRVGFLAKNHPGQTESRGPKIAHGSAAAKGDGTPDHHHIEKHRAGFVRTLSAEINHGRRSRSRQSGPTRGAVLEEIAEREHHTHGEDAHHHDRKSHRKYAASEESLRKPREVKREGAVIIGRIVGVEALRGNFLGHERYDALIVVRRFEFDPQKAK